jgi:putative DNA primase/helicase
MNLQEACEQVGIEFVPVPTDSKLHPVPVTGKGPRNTAGRIKLFSDGAGGVVMNNIDATSLIFWHDDTLATMTKADKAARTAQIAKEQQELDESRRLCREQSHNLFNNVARDTMPAKHPYLTAKGIKPFGIKYQSSGGLLVIPVTDTADILHGLQFIAGDGAKKFKTGTVKAGHFHQISGGSQIVICEGYATGASIHEATGATVIIAFDAGNLLSVATALRSKHPDHSITIAADNDTRTPGNPGVTKATAAAQMINASLAVATFTPEQIETFGIKSGTAPTDFNDLHQTAGLDALRVQIEAAAIIEDQEQQSPPANEGASLAGSTLEWPDPSPLPEGLPPVKPLKPAMIPLPLRGWLMDISERLQIPPDFSAAAAVVALGSIIGRGCGIHPKCRDDWLVVPNLWGAVIGRPSLMKTPAMMEAFRHLARLEVDAKTIFEAESNHQAAVREVAKAGRMAIIQSITKAVKAGKDTHELQCRLETMKSEEPTRTRYQTQDGTTEKIGELLNQNHRGMLVNRDELIGWLRGLERDGREGDRGFYLEAWNGTGSFTYDRIGRGTLDIMSLCLSVFGAITPGNLSDYVYQAKRGGRGDDGLLQRFQMIVWPDDTKIWKNIDRFPSTEERERVWRIFHALATNDIPGAVTEENATIPALRFSAEAQETFNHWRQVLEDRLRGELSPEIESHLAKYRSLMPSLALIFHLVSVADGAEQPGPVSHQAAHMAVAWCEYLESHATRIYGGAATPGMESAKEIIKHIKRDDIKDGMTIRDIWKAQWTKLASSEEVKAGLAVLEEYDWLITEKTINTRGGRPKESIKLNPKISIKLL